MNFKRKRPKNARAGCLMCKPYKINGCSHEKRLKNSDRRKLDSAREQFPCEGYSNEKAR